uniref:Uncharacterized protein n=1 Tax=Latimeria chalumnae TaxID=7897 RepID=H3AB24_LATCH
RMKWKVKEGANSISIMTVVAKRLKIELSCSLCLDLYTDPVLLDCDHNFCQKCISKVEEGVDGSVKCPQCWQVIRTRRFRVNRSLANIMESYKGAQGDSRLYCEEHGAKLQLFCKEEQKVIGLVCGVSEHHRDHQHTPIAEAVEPYKKKLEASLKALQEAETEAKRCLNEEKEDIKKLQVRLEDRTLCLKKMIKEEFSKLHDFLNKEKKKQEKLEDMERSYMETLVEIKAKTSDEISKLQKAISEVEGTLNKNKVDLLKDIKATLDRTEVKFIKPERHSMDLCEGQVIGPLQYKVWKRMRECIIPDAATSMILYSYSSYPSLPSYYTEIHKILLKALESITIDPATAHKHLTVSRDWSSVKHGLMQQDLPDGLERFKSSFAALGSKGFTSGRHYWEVEVGDKAFWILGVAKESVERKEYFSHTDQNGVWVLCLRNGHNYVICTSPVKTLPVHVELRKIRVLLDFEGGQVSFYSADDMSHIYTYTDTFTERIYPFFNPYCNLAEEANKPLRILP